MDWTHVLGIILGNAAFVIPLFIWNRSESRADIRHLDTRLEANRELVHAIHLEMKDFHNRLYNLEEKRMK
ncbi:MAG: hypothetical protein PHH73_06345 [Candidatus Rickettsiella isopodorum]|nr:hypothetical protein [Candidatus Rickettsiella isopodorum]